MTLPAPRTEGRYAIALVCLGNICRSPMADVVLGARIEEAGLAERVTVASSGTGGWHVGDPMDRRAAATLTAAGYDASRHRARQFTPAWLEEFDLVLAMDAQNLADIGGEAARVRLFRDFDPLVPGGEVPDPYYGGADGFEEVLTMVERTAATIVAHLEAALRPETLRPETRHPDRPRAEHPAP
ncbi:low molecular weight protein-tyrosine-phosphatase [Nocardioides sp. MAHUQ-72]|uniref:low molecular weight protein-tyrosine-phosphatase n=1 Tax=unclassified Nocardioides TaxID=2615069 RepID=UPI0036060483